MTELILFNKPFQVMSQFSAHDARATLADFIDLPGVYPAGRLDYDSEGLMILTDDGKLQHRISHPRHKLSKTYWVQVEGQINKSAVCQLCQGVELKDGLTMPATAALMDEPDDLWPRDPPIRYRANIPTSWLSLTISEGRNRQVRRMTAAVGFPTLRLVRAAIGPWSVSELAPGEYRRLTLSREELAKRFPAPPSSPISRRSPSRRRGSLPPKRGRR